MPSPRSAILAAASLFAFIAVTSIRALAAPEDPAWAPDQVLIKFRDSAPPGRVQAILAELGARRLRRFSRIRASHEKISRMSVPDAVARFRGDPVVEFIEPNYIVKAFATPNDPRYPEQWALRNIGQTGGRIGADIQAPDAWDATTGASDVLVAIIDTGVDYTHPDLSPNIFVNSGEIPANGMDDDGNGYVDDVHGWDFANGDNDPMDDNLHGTHVAGTVGAVGNNGVGVAGVAWHVRILPLKFLGSGGSGLISDAVSCVEYATAMGARIMSNSWGGGYSEALREAIQDASDAGILFVAAAGNSAGDNDISPVYPASYDITSVISVAATDDNDRLAAFSCYGATSVDLAAPGVSILNTVPGGGYTLLSGTSMATPHVSGVLALVLARHPGITAEAAKARLLAGVDRLPDLAGRMVSGGRLNAFLALADPDSTPPEPIADLTVVEPLSGGAVLRWTSPADAGVVGRAERYEIYDAPFPLDDSSIGSATLSAAAPEPLPAGSVQQADVLGLPFGTTYWFAVVSVDNFGNRSAVSNVVSATTLGAPTAVATPEFLQASALTGARTSVSLTIGNAGAGSLEFEVVGEPAVTETAGAAGAGDPGTLGAGGPDRFGYRWIDSREPAGPAFEWIELSGTGTPVPIGGDDITTPALPIGFPFPFYGTEFTGFHVSTNGFLSFTSTSTTHTNQLLPNFTAPENLLAVFWDDLAFGPGAYGYYHSDGTRLVVEWTGARLLNGAGPYTFEVILDRTGSIVFQYAAMGGPVDGATVGIQDGTGTDGLTIAVNSPYVTDGLAVRLAPSARWLSISPSRGRVFAPGSEPVRIDLDATGLGAGPHGAVLRVRTNDPARAELDVPLLFTVTGGPDISVSTASLDVGGAPVGGTATDSVAVGNPGTDTLRVDALSIDSPDFTADPATLTLAPGETATVAVTFHAAALGPAAATLTIRSNDPDEPEARVALSAAGVPPAEMRLNLPVLAASLPNGGAETQRISISNTGGGDLDWSISVRPVAGADPPPPVVLPLILRDPVGDARRCDLTVLRGWIAGGNLEMEMEFAAPIDVNDFGGYLWLDVDQDPSTGRPSPADPSVRIGAEYRLEFFKLPFHLVVLYGTTTYGSTGSFPVTVGPASLRFSLPLFALGGDHPAMNFFGVLGGTVVSSEWIPNEGFGTVTRVPWLSVSPLSGRVPPGGTVTVNAEFNAGPLGPGGYDADLLLASNDPSAPGPSLAAHLDVSAAPVLVLSDSTVAFGTVYVGGAASDSVIVSNEGADTLRVTSVTADRAEVHAGPGAFVVPPGGRGTLAVQFAPAAAGSVAAKVTLTHNSGDGLTAVPVTGEGVSPPAVAVEPSTIRFDLGEGERASRDLTIRNDGAGVLDWALRPSVGPVPTATDSVGALDAGGPDEFGYRWDDSDEPGGPAFQWVELRGVGRLLPLAGDDLTLANVPIGFPFPFYGTEFNTINVCSNGIASFTSTAAPYSPRFLPSPSAPENLLAPLWFDLLVDAPNSGVYAHSDGTRFILEFDNIRHPYWPGTVTFEMILYRTGVILYQYKRIDTIPVEYAVVGLQDGTRTDGLTALPYPKHVREQLAIRIAPAPRWLAVVPDAGRVAPSSSAAVSLTADATGSPPGDFDAHLTLRNNDPQRPAVRIPVAFHVTGVPRLLAGVARLDFGDVFLGVTAAETLAVTNAGSAPLTVSALTPSRSEYEAAPSALTLAPLETAPVAVLFHAAGPAGRKDGTLTIQSDDPASPLTIELRAEAVVPPDIDVAPALIEAAAPDGGKALKSLTICNTGGSGLVTRIGAAAPWAAVEPDSGAVAAGACVEWKLTLDAAGLAAGDYADTLAIASNDPDEPSVWREVLFHVGTVEAAAAEIGPTTLNRESRGRLVMAYVELPPGLDPGRVVLSSVRFNGTVPVTQPELILGDFNANGTPDLQFKFDRAAVEAILPDGETVPLAVTGEVRDTRWFAGHDTVRVFRPTVASPNGGETLAAGSTTRVRWANPAGRAVTAADVFYSFDGGRTWDPVALGVRGTSAAWAVPEAETDSAEIRVYVSDAGGPLGFDGSDGAFRTRFPISDVEADAGPLPTVYALRENHPNPFNPMTWIRYDLPRAGRVALRVYDARGRLTRTLVDGAQPAGRHQVAWDGRDDAGRSAASGVYFYRIRAERFQASRRMLLLK